MKNLALMVDAVHEHGALSGVELFYGSSMTSNRATREMPLSPSGLPMLRAGGRGQFQFCLCELLAENGHRVTYVTPADLVSAWCGNTNDQWYAQQRLIELGVTIVTGFFVSDFDGESATLSGRYAGEVRELEAATLAVVGAREPQDALYRTLAARAQDLRAAGIRTLQKIGDCDVPAAVVHATYAGHRLAREFDANVAPMLLGRTRLDS